jgi:hypothetical protein
MPGITNRIVSPARALSDGPRSPPPPVTPSPRARRRCRKGLALALRARPGSAGLDIARGELDALNAAAIVHAMRGDLIAAVAAGIDA